METIIEGEPWNEFEFRRVQPEDVEVIDELLRSSYYPDEPMTKMLGFSEEYENDFRKIWSTFFKDNLSFFAIETKTGKTAGIRFMFDHKKGMDWTRFDFKAPQTAALFVCVNLLDEQGDIFEKYKVDHFADLFTTCVRPEFRGKGLVTEMYRRAIRLTRYRGFPLATAICSSPWSRKGAEDAGFKQVASIHLQYARDKKGDLIIPKATTQDQLTRALIQF